MKGKIGWVDCHHHSEFSLLDGYGKLDDHVARAVELGHPAVAFTEHGTMRGFVSLDAAAKKHKIKPIYGCEFYVTRDHTKVGLNEEQIASVSAGLGKRDANAAIRELERTIGVHEARHLVVIALDEEGYRNLLILNNIANRDGFLRTRAGGKPRIDLNLLEKHNGGLAVSTACLGGVLAQSWLAGDIERVVDDALHLRDVFGPERFSIEIQPHPIPEQRRWNKFAMKLSSEIDVPLIVTNDSHYIVEKDWETHDALITMRFGSTLADPDRIRYVPKQFAMRSEDSVFEAFEKNGHDIEARILDAGIERAAELADRATAELWKPSRLLLPTISKTPEDDLKEFCLEGWEWRQVETRARRTGHPVKAYLVRLSHELKVIRDLKFAPYFLVVHDMIRWARLNGIMTGPGRGSAAGSLVCYLLGITAIDPLEHGLLFERFLTPGRKDWPDIDCDVERERRGEVFAYLRERYGADKVAQIGTISRMRGRSALRDVARVHGVHPSIVDKVTSTIVSSVIRAEGEASIAEALEESPALEAFAKDYPRVINTTLILEGHIRHIGIHAAGVIASPIPLDDLFPLETRVSKGETTTAIAYDMHDVETVGGIKIDLLGLTTLSVLATAVRLVKERTGEEIDLESIDLNDAKVLRLFTELDFVGVFQFDSPTARGACAGVIFESFEDIASMNAINRPGVSKAGLDDEWKRRKADPTKIVSLHPVIDAACSDSFGVIIYQEHIIKILQDLAGFSPEEAGRLRKAISKSKGVGYLEAEREPFVDGATKAGMDPGDADRLWTQIEQFGAYGFNKTISQFAWVLRAGRNAQMGTPWIQVKDLVELSEQRVNGRLTPIARKIRAGRLNLIQMDEDGRCRPGRLVAIHDHGVKPVFELVTESGVVMPAMSSKHRVMTPDGWRSIESGLAVGSEIVMMGELETRAHVSWWGTAEQRASMTGRMNETYRSTVDFVWKRASGKCETCGCDGERRRGGHEVAHIKPITEADEFFHHPTNLKLLCNSCHKRLDYAKGERTSRWGKGRPTYTEKVAEIRFVGEVQCYDLEMESEGHNYVAASAPGLAAFISHNSHAAAYGAIAFWCQYLKVHHPIEFFAALLANELDANKANRIVREAARRGVKIEPPNLNESGQRWTVRRGVLVAGLSGIKGVGENACSEILRGQPYTSLPDFLTRVNRRVVNRGVLVNLAKSGALRPFHANTGWLVEHLEEITKIVGKKKGWTTALDELLEQGRAARPTTAESEWAMRLEVGVAGSGEHPLGILGPMDDAILRRDWGDLGSPKDGDLLRGVVTARKVGTSNGAKWASLEIEDEVGKQFRVRFDSDGYARWREIIDLGPGSVLAMRVAIGSRGGARADYLVDLLDLRRTWVEKGRLEATPTTSLHDWPTWQACLIRGEHPTHHAINGIAAGDGWWKRTRPVNVLVVSVKTVLDKNRNEMAFLRVEGTLGRVKELVVFASSWEELARKPKAGKIVGIRPKTDQGRGSILTSSIVNRKTYT